MKKIDKISI